MSNAAICAPRVLENRVAVEPHAAREPMLLAENEVLGDRVVEDEPARVAVFGNVRQPGVAARLDRESP